MTECYICLDPCNNTSKCLCTNLYVHDKCLMENILKSNSTLCSVCKHEYNNVSIKYSISCVCHNRIYIAILVITSTGSLILYICGLTLVIMYLTTNNNKNIMYIVTGYILIIIGIIIMYIYTSTYKYIKNNNITLFELIKKKIVINNDIIV